MQLYLQFPTNLQPLELYVENKTYILWWNAKSEKEIAGFFMNNFPWEVMEEQSVQYETNFVSIRKLKKIDKDIFNKVRWIYYGSDNCEYLMPTKEEVAKALDYYNIIRKRDSFEWSFVLNTPYLWEKMLNRAKEALLYLNEQNTKYKIEVVINDLWLLRFLEKECPNLHPIAWRLMHKLLKTPLVDTYWNKAHVAWKLISNQSSENIKKMQEKIVEYQNKFYQSSEDSFWPFNNFLKRHKIERTTLDFLENRDTLYSNRDNLDLYYPYALVFTGRLCDTSAIENPERWNYALNEVCNRTCHRYDLTYKIKTVWYNLLQKGNAWYRTETDLDKLDKTFLEKRNDNRLVFSPFI